VSILEVERPVATPPSPRRRGGRSWAGALIAVLLVALVAGIVVNKVADDRNGKKRADQRPSAVSCQSLLPLLNTATTQVLNFTTKEREQTVQKLAGLQKQVAVLSGQGTTYDRARNADATVDLRALETKAADAKITSLEPGPLLALGNMIAQAC
jgi:type VI protein secretion system component VasK